MNGSGSPTQQPSTAKEIFVSYAHEDATPAKALISELERQGWGVWWDERLRSGDDFSDSIDRVLGEVGAVVVLWSRAAVRSEFVKSEAQRGWDFGKLTPVLIEEGVDLPFPFNRTHATALLEWPERRNAESLAALFTAIAEKLAAPRPEKRRRTPMWVPRLLAAVCSLLLAWVLWTMFLHYTPIVSITSAVVGASVMLAIATFRRSSVRFAADHLLRRGFIRRDGRLRVAVCAAGSLVAAGLVVALAHVQPRFEITAENELDTSRELFPNVRRHGGGVVRPEWLLVELDTRYNVIERSLLSIRLKPYGKVQFADLQSDGALGFEWRDLPPLDGVIEIPVTRLRGEAQVWVRWKHGEYAEVPEDARLVATLTVGDWSDEDELALSK